MAIICQNSPHWCIADLSIISVGAVTVPGYITSTENELVYLLNHSEAKGVFVSQEILKKIIKIEDKLKYLKFIICFDKCNKELKNIEVYDYHHLILMPFKNDDKNFKKNSINKEDLACIIYTSGTSSNPKE